jgi:hypothetical protein
MNAGAAAAGGRQIFISDFGSTRTHLDRSISDLQASEVEVTVSSIRQTIARADLLLRHLRTVYIISLLSRSSLDLDLDPFATLLPITLLVQFSVVCCCWYRQLLAKPSQRSF